MKLTPQHSAILVEACVTSMDEALAAQEAGADRLELCREFACGGLTPDADLVSRLLPRLRIPLHVLIRNQPGFEPLSAEALECKLQQMRELGRAGVSGFVMGPLAESREVDMAALHQMRQAAGDAALTFHRAFDRITDPVHAIDALAAAGVTRILCSGGSGTAWEGRKTLTGWRQGLPAGIGLLAGGGVRGDHVVELVRQTGIREVHAQAAAIPAIVAALCKAGLRA